jgi:Family of unknown function (DUF6370)
MRTLIATLMLVCAGLMLSAGANFADEKKDKEVVLKGLICCNKCELGKSTKCETVIQVKADKTETVYFFDAASHKKFHGDICNEAKKGSVTGTVKDDGKKKVVSVTKVAFD